ncbi:MAG: histidine kinase [Saprospiraceae bacterium]|nr:histidine kinase [Saprospiraceae bacterium]
MKSENQWWLFTDDGLIKFDFANVMNNKLFKYSQSSKDVMYLGVNFKEFIFITSDHYGVLIFDTKSQKFIRRKPFESLGLHYIFCDRHNRLWLTNIYRDIEIYTIQQFLSNSNDTLNGFTSNQVEIKDDIKVFISQNKGLLIKKDGETRLLELETKKLPIKSIYKAKIIDDNNILLCDLFNIYHYNWTIKKIRKISLPNIRQIEDLNSFRDTLYILSNNTLHRFLWPSLIKINSDIFNKYDYRFDHLCNVTDDMITLCHGDEYVRFSSFSNVSVFIDSYIYNSVYEPYGQEHYLATQNGLFLLIETHNVKSLTDFSPILKDNPVEQIAQSKNFVYFVANNLICRHHKKTERIDIFDQYVFETTPIFGIDSDKLTIAGEQIMEIPLSDAFVSKNKYKLLLDYVLVNNNKTHLENLNDLKHNENSLKWRFYIPDYLHSNVNKIGYRVIPALDTSWIFINNHREIELSNLAPNKYTIQIKAFFANGQISDIRDYSFTILNPWYKTWYFLLLALTTTIIFGFILSKKYIQSIHQKHAIEKQITDLQRSALQAQMNPHFIFNCLNSIQNYIMRNDKDIAMEYLTKFARLIRQYLNASNTDLVTLDDEISMLTNYLHLEQMRFNQSFEYHFQVDKNLDPTEITLPPLLIQPFVENAILHGMTSITNGGQINIDISKKENQLQITIKDNGKGFDKNKNTGMRRSLGISITQKRLQYINDHAEGNYAISTTSYESGTEINITVKLT